jgi:UDP-glucose 4-epimerase
MKRFLITGGLGFIGSHVVLELLNANNYVMVLDNFSNSDEEVLEKLKKIGGDRLQFYPVDVANEREIYECGGLIREEIDWIIHFAAYKNVGESADMPAEYYYNNLVNTILIL